MKRLAIILILCLALVSCKATKTETEFLPGDVIFQTLGGDFGDLIAGVTGSPLNHCGMIVPHNGELVVIEALGTVRYTPIKDWTRRGNGKYILLRPKNLSDEKIANTIETAKGYLGRLYDFQFELDDDKLYCSLLVHLAYEKGAEIKVGEKIKLGDMNWEEHEDYIRILADGDLPLGREIIPPHTLLDSEHFDKVFSNMKGE